VEIETEYVREPSAQRMSFTGTGGDVGEMGGGFGSFDNSKPAAVQWVFALHEAGLLTIPAGSSVIRFLPPLNLTQEEAQAGLDLFEQTIQKVIE